MLTKLGRNVNATGGYTKATLTSFTANINSNMIYTRKKVTGTKAPPTFRNLKRCMEIRLHTKYRIVFVQVKSFAE